MDKVPFTLQPEPGSGLPQVLGGGNRLNAPPTMLVSKVDQYAHEKSKIPVEEDRFEITTLGGDVLDHSKTLQTIMHCFNSMAGSNVALYYRRAAK